MRFLPILFLFSSISYAGEGLNAYDKKLHMAASYGVALTSILVFKKNGSSTLGSIIQGTFLTMTLGLGKELYSDDHFSGMDMVANLIGTGIGAGVSLYF